MWGATVLAQHHPESALRSLETSDLFTVVLDQTGRLHFGNRRVRGLTGDAARAIVGHLERDLAAIVAGTPSTTSEQLLPQVGGPALVVRWHGVAFEAKAGEPVALLAIGEDVTEDRERERGLADQALRDPLTGLPNRALLDDRLAQAIRTAERQEVPCALLMLDLNGFKTLNDRSGHDVGDELLRQIGPRIRTQLRESDTVARQGGDEFAVLLPPPADLVSALAAAQKVAAALAEPFVIDDELVTAEASIGVALFPEHAATGDALRRAADVAMYTAKRFGQRIAVFDADQDLRSRAVVKRADALRRAIETGALRLEYQPAFDLRENTMTRAEALVRWDHPSRGILRPAAFLPLAERTGLTKPLLAWVLANALAGCAEWRAAGADAGVSVNLSLRDITDPDLPTVIREALESFAVPARTLTLEVKERDLGREPRRALQALSRLAETGVRIALDDFGRGDISLRDLRRMPLDEVKLDGRIVDSMCADPKSWGFVRSGIDLGHDLGIEVVAKGIEDGVTRDLLSRLGCDVGQGHFVARPVRSADVAGVAGRN